MKKFLMYALTAVLALNLVACGDDDDDNPTAGEEWKAISKTYQGNDNLTVTVSGTTLVTTVDGRSVVVEATSATAANVTLNNIIFGTTSVPVVAEMKEENGAYTLTSAADGRSFAFTGSVKDGKLKLDINLAVNTPITGTWKLKMNPVEGQPITAAQIYLDINTGDAATDAMLTAMIPQMLGPVIGGKVSAVNAMLKTDGTFDTNWVKLGESDPTGMPPAVAAMVKIYYGVNDGNLMLGLDKGLISMLQAFAGDALAGLGLDLDTLLGMMVDMGGYYGLPLNYTLDGDTASFYVTKEMIVKLLPLLTPMLEDSVPAEMLPIVQGMIAAITNAEKFNFGLTFEK